MRKHQIFLNTLIFAIALCGLVTVAQLPSSTKVPQEIVDPTVPELVAAFNANSGALVSLAVERFHYDQRQGKKCIMTLVRDIEVSKYSDGEFNVVLLPQDDGTNFTGIERFVHAYNHMVIRDADAQMNAGKLDHAEKAFKLILKYDLTSGFKNELKMRLQIISEIRTNAAVSLPDKLSALQPDYDLFSFIADMGTKPPTIVSNLLELQIKDLVTPPTALKTNVAIPTLNTPHQP